jgi:hypothetical protein
VLVEVLVVVVTLIYLEEEGLYRNTLAVSQVGEDYAMVSVTNYRFQLHQHIGIISHKLNYEAELVDAVSQLSYLKYCRRHGNSESVVVHRVPIQRPFTCVCLQLR